MITKTYTYTDFKGVSRTEKFRFHMTEAEVVMMQNSVDGGMKEYLERISEALDIPSVMKNLRLIIHKAYGEISDDGRRFVKKAADGHDLADDFEATEAYSMLVMELLSDEGAAAAFINGIMPSISGAGQAAAAPVKVIDANFSTT